MSELDKAKKSGSIKIRDTWRGYRDGLKGREEKKRYDRSLEYRRAFHQGVDDSYNELQGGTPVEDL